MNADKINYLLHLADNALLLGHRNSEWCGHGPVLEQDIAITNISLDLIGQARNFYQHVAALKNDGTTEDTLAFLRNADEFKNCLLTEQPKGDWAKTILRQFLFSTYQFFLYTKLQYSKDEQLAAITAKALKEVTYHLRWSSEWVIRLGDGTAESHQRMNNAITELWPYTDELFTSAAYESEYIDNKQLQKQWEERIAEVFSIAGLTVPSKVHFTYGGKAGEHSTHLHDILQDLQFMQRTYPNMAW